jgi:Ca2+/H+ antiporter, TMEM165/GDT1 family
MRSNWMVSGLKIALFLAIVIAGFGQAVLQLWNLVMPGIFGLHRISFWQAVGLLALSWLLFGWPGIFRARMGYPSHWRHRMAERMEQMPPEQREQFRRGLRRRRGPAEAAAPEPKL